MGLHEPAAARSAVHIEPAAAAHAFRGKIADGIRIGHGNRAARLLLRPVIPVFLMKFGAKLDRH